MRQGTQLSSGSQLTFGDNHRSSKDHMNTKVSTGDKGNAYGSNRSPLRKNRQNSHDAIKNPFSTTTRDHNTINVEE